MRSPGAISCSTGCDAPLNLVIVGFTPALRVRVRTSDTCSSIIGVTTVPSAPARAVLAGGGERVIHFVMLLRWVGYAPVTASAVRKGRYRGVAVFGLRRT